MSKVRKYLKFKPRGKILLRTEKYTITAHKLLSEITDLNIF